MIGLPEKPYPGNDGQTTWHGFARGIEDQLRSRGIALKAEAIVPITTEQRPRLAPRPAYSVLSTLKFTGATGVSPRPWSDALRRYFDRTLKDS